VKKVNTTDPPQATSGSSSAYTAATPSPSFTTTDVQASPTPWSSLRSRPRVSTA